VFEDIGFPPHEARRLLLQSQLAIAIEQFIRRRNLTQARAAKIFGVTQPRISDLMRGRLDKFSIDMLITMLVRAGMEVRIAVTSPKAA
jgi:predicted XRE-type DNA-binding protein